MPARKGSKKVNKYSLELKRTAVRLTQAPEARVKDVAESLDIHPFMLSRWRKLAREGLLTKKPKVKARRAPSMVEMSNRGPPLNAVVRQLPGRCARLTCHIWPRHNMACGASRNIVAWTNKSPARLPRSSSATRSGRTLPRCPGRWGFASSRAFATRLCPGSGRAIGRPDWEISGASSIASWRTRRCFTSRQSLLTTIGDLDERLSPRQEASDGERRRVGSDSSRTSGDEPESARRGIGHFPDHHLRDREWPGASRRRAREGPGPGAEASSGRAGLPGVDA